MPPYAVLAALVPVLLFPAHASAQTGPQAYQEACQGCHGEAARGDGPKAALLSEPVPDLTRFAARNDGIFDRARMVRLIDGREGLSAHGGPMPMFGGLLTGPSAVLDGPDGSPVTTTEPILAIVDYLESIQED